MSRLINNSLQPQQVVFSLGQEKVVDTARRRKSGVHFTTKQAQTRAICRAVMRHPDDEVKTLMLSMKDKLKNLLVYQSDEGIEWLLGAERQRGWGVFKDAKSLREFLNSDNVSNARLITGLHVITVCMAYRAMGNNHVLPPHNPVTTAQKQMFAVCKALYQPNTVPAIAKLYTGKYTEQIEGDTNNINPRFYVEMTRDDVSVVSDIHNDDPVLPKEAMPEKKYKLYDAMGKPTWAAVAQQHNVELRCHASGTTTKALSVICGLLPPELRKDPRVIKKISGALILPNMLRGDYHSIAESAAGVDFYLNPRTENRLHPKYCEALGYRLLASAASKNVNGVDLQSAILHTAFGDGSVSSKSTGSIASSKCKGEFSPTIERKSILRKLLKHLKELFGSNKYEIQVVNFQNQQQHAHRQVLAQNNLEQIQYRHHINHHIPDRGFIIRP